MKKKCQLTNKETLTYLDNDIDSEQVIILVHGNMSSGVHFEPLTHALPNEYRVIAPDMRGFGDSSYNQVIDSLEDFADDLNCLLDTLHIEKIHLAGWSTGGGIALKFAAKYPHRTQSLILINSASYRGYPIYKKDASMQPVLGEQYQSKEDMAKDPVQVAPVANALASGNVAFMHTLWTSAIYNIHVPENINLYLEETMKQRNLIDLDWALMTLNMSKTHNGVTEGDGTIEAIQAPVLAIHGAKDMVVPRSMFDETVKALTSCEVHVFDTAGHSPVTDLPDALANKIHSFIQKQ